MDDFISIMKLLLTSSGLSNKKVLDFFISLLPREPRNCSALMVAYVQNEEEQSYVDISKKELVDCGIGTIATVAETHSRFFIA
ncbi:MAG: hypothetical protein HYW78_00475 [Parcubacteria group bacterium]|nr:hypothetical protein [Parcubacteria group bacterium]